MTCYDAEGSRDSVHVFLRIELSKYNHVSSPVTTRYKKAFRFLPGKVDFTSVFRPPISLSLNLLAINFSSF